MKTDVKKNVKTAKKSIVICISVILLASMLSSCSNITVNFDKIFPADGSFEPTSDGESINEIGSESESENASESANANGNSERDTLDIYEYKGKEISSSYLESIGEHDFGGQTVFIKTTDPAMAEKTLFPDFEENGTNSYSAAVYERNRMVEEKLNCEFHYRTTTVEEMTADIKAALKNEEYYSDLLAVRESELPVLIKEGYLYNLRSLPFLDPDEEYFNYSASVSLSAGYCDYGIISYATIDPNSISCIFMRTDLLKNEAADEVFSAVKSGGWTFEMLAEISSEGGIVTDFTADDVADVISSSLGITFVNNSSRSVPTVYLNEKAFTATDILKTFSDIIRIYDPENSGDTETSVTAQEAFCSAGAAFYLGKLGDMEKFSNASFEWSVLPVPKVSAEGSYSSYVTEDTLVLSVPINTADPDGASVLLKALSAASAGYLRDAYVEYHMYNTVSSFRTLSMIETVYDSPFFSFERSLGSGSSKIADGTYNILRSVFKNGGSGEDVKSLFKKNEAGANKALKERYRSVN